MEFGNLLKEHIDASLGPEPSGAFVDDRLGVTVATFSNKPHAGLCTTLTIGVSKHVLPQPSGRNIRQELLSTSDARYSTLPWHEALLATASLLLERHAALMLGEVVGPFGRIFSETPWCSASAFLCAPPLFFDEGFSELYTTDPPLMFVELVPVTESEAKWIGSHGWSKFFERVNTGEVDIMNLERLDK